MNDNRDHDNEYGKQHAAAPNRWDSDNQAERETTRNQSEQKRVMSVKGAGRGKHNNPGNFANDRARAATAGRKGGEARGHRQQSSH